MKTHHLSLEFDVILNQLVDCAFSPKAKDILRWLSPLLDEAACQRAMEETTHAKYMLEGFGSPPLSAMEGMEESVAVALAGGRLTIEQLEEIARFCISCRRLSAYLQRGRLSENVLSAYSSAFEPLDGLQNAIEDAVLHGSIRDDATPLLRRIRRDMLGVEARIKEKLNHILQTRKSMLSDGYYAKRNGRYVLPVRKQFQHQFGGTVIDASRTGGTVFMEPSGIAALQAEWEQLAIEEELEMQRILYVLSDLTASNASALQSNAARMTELDVLFAKAALSVEMHANPIAIGCERRLVLRSARHPLLDPQTCVPLDLSADENCRGIVITGPNTGGKTATLKTVGLLTLMAQCGLHVPCAEGSYLPMRDHVLCDIGDSQSLTSNLSTFSGHMTNVLEILDTFTSESLILLDELGSGTDPTEGMAIAVAVLEALRVSGCFLMVTTHYPEVKAYVQNAQGLLSARMAFDQETLRPLYQLELGKTGESCALEIVRRLGMPTELLQAAKAVAAGGISAVCLSELPRKRGQLKHKPAPKSNSISVFQMGDSVNVLPENEKGIIYRPTDENGDVIVQIKGVKRAVRHTRIRLLVPASELYPDDYDFSIIFDTVENRKARHMISRRYDADATIIHRTGKE